MKDHINRANELSWLASVTVCITLVACAGEPLSTVDELANATYTDIQVNPVTLSNGQWQGAPYVEGGASRPRVGLVDDIYVAGDLDGDGKPEAVVLLWESSGGTGSYIYVAVMSRQEGDIRNIATALVGDRVKIRSATIDDGEIILDVLQAGENDAMCCPTMLATRRWSLKNMQLQESEIEITGKHSLKEDG